jgi:diguanylate cyclase (GGDEF)-like protein/putative nucleotidyltransferase with HDIG domain
MAALHLRAIEGLALAVEAKDSLNTRGHLRRVRVYAVGIGEDLGLKGDELEALQAGALLHDIGKLAVPEYILTKPGKLTPEEFAKMKVHPIVGAEIVEQVQFPYPVAPIVRAHHEKWDGTGYPFGLKGEDIPIGARILTAVDYLDALASDREYRRALPLDDAMKRVEEEAGKALDPKVVEALGRRYRELEQKAKATTDQGTTLSKHAKVERGSAPDAGLALWALAGVPAGADDFVHSIAAVGKEQQAVLELMQGLGSSLDLNRILQRVESGLRPLIPHEAMAIFISQGDTLVAEHSAGECKDLLSPEVRAGEGMVGWVAQNEQPIVNGNPTVEAGFRGRPADGLQAAIAVPLKRSGALAGVLAYYRREKDSFTGDHLRILTDIAPRIGVAIENAIKVKEIEERANMDVTTGLQNLQGLTEALEVELIRSKRQKQPLAVIVAEFAGVVSLNGDPSHPQTDGALRSIAQFLKEGCREYDHVARIGDDTFAMILPGMKRETIGFKIETLYSTVSKTFPQWIENGTVRFALGTALYPDDADTSKLLLAVAEGRNEKRASGPAESLLALHAHNRAEVEPARHEETAFDLEESGAAVPERRAGW